MRVAHDQEVQRKRPIWAARIVDNIDPRRFDCDEVRWRQIREHLERRQRSPSPSPLGTGQALTTFVASLRAGQAVAGSVLMTSHVSGATQASAATTASAACGLRLAAQLEQKREPR